jgi:hypothetical protein
LPLCRKDRASHRSSSQSTRRYPSSSSPASVGTPLETYVVGGCRRAGANVPAPVAPRSYFRKG